MFEGVNAFNNAIPASISLRTYRKYSQLQMSLEQETTQNVANSSVLRFSAFKTQNPEIVFWHVWSVFLLYFLYPPKKNILNRMFSLCVMCAGATAKLRLGPGPSPIQAGVQIPAQSTAGGSQVVGRSNLDCTIVFFD